MFKYVFSHVSVHRRQWVIEEVDVGVTVHGPGQAHALLLAPGQVHALRRHMAEGGFAGKPQDMQGGQPAWDSAALAGDPAGLHPPQVVQRHEGAPAPTAGPRPSTGLASAGKQVEEKT